MASRDFVRQCCVCHLVMDDGAGKKIQLSENATTWKGLPVSHGYCKPCMELEREKLRQIVAAQKGGSE